MLMAELHDCSSTWFEHVVTRPYMYNNIKDLTNSPAHVSVQQGADRSPVYCETYQVIAAPKALKKIGQNNNNN